MYFIRLQYGRATDLLYSVKGKYSYLEPTLVCSSQNCRTIRTKWSLTWGLLLWNEVTQWNNESNGLPWALPNFIPTWHVSQQVPGLRLNLCLAGSWAAAPGRASSEMIPYLHCICGSLEFAKLTFVLVISLCLPQPSLSSFLNENKHLLEERTGL